MDVLRFCIAAIFFLASYNLNSGTFIVKFKKNFDSQLLNERFSNIKAHFSELQFSKMLQTSGNKLRISSQSLLSSNMANKLLGYYVLEIPDSLIATTLSEINSFPEIDFIEPNIKIGIEQDNVRDSDLQKQWYINFVRAHEAWKKSTGKGIRVGIIDTGIDFGHEDLKNRIWINPQEDINHTGQFEPWPDSVKINGITGDLNGVDDDGNGFIDDIIGYDFVNQTYGNLGDYSIPDAIPFDEHGHGTMVAGVIAADINGMGIVGVAPEVKIVALRAFDLTGNAEIKDIANAIVYSALNGISVLNLSFGSQEYSRLLEDAISFAQSMGCIVVASAGNDGTIISHYPSDFNGVISVGSITLDGTIANSSNFGPNVDIFAPGVEIYTTSLNNTYRYISGTSFSAPVVSAGCALLLSLDSTLKGEEILGILKATQKKILGKGMKYSHGYVDFAESVSFFGSSRFEILNIHNDDEFLKEEVITVPIQIFAYSPFFFQYDLYLYKNDTTLAQRLVEHSSKQSIGNRFDFNVGNLDEGQYTLKLIATLRNGNQIEKSVRFFVYSRDSSIKVESLDWASCIYENRTFYVLATSSNLPTFCRVIFFTKDGKKLLELSDETYSQLHFIPFFGIENIADRPLTFRILYTTKSGKEYSIDTAINEFGYNNSISYSKKFNTLPLSYLFNYTVPINSSRFDGLMLNPYDNLNWKNLELYKFSDTGFAKLAELKEPWIPVDTGDSNGDGKLEVLTTLLGRTRLLQPEGEPQNYFNNVLFQSEPNSTLWAAKMKDFNRDGKDELICFDDTSILVISYENGKYKTISRILPQDSFGVVGTKPNIQIADFDSDGNYELALFTTRGCLLIYQYDKALKRFDLEYSLKTEGAPFSTAACIGKLKSNQNFSIFFIQSKYFEDKTHEQLKGSLWNLFKVDASSKDTYSITYEKSFYGVRSGSIPQGIFYRNGINAGNLDKEDGDELLVSLFPNFYVLKFGADSIGFTPILWIPFVYSNSAIVNDFDNNGVNEFGISNWDGLRFYELNVKVKLFTPSFLDGWLDSTNKINFYWEKVENADKYEIYEILPNGNINLVGMSYSNDFMLEVVNPPNSIEYIVRGINDSGNYEPSDFTNPIRIYFFKPTRALSVEVVSPKQIEIHFTGKLPLVFANKSVIQIYDDNLKEIGCETLQRANDTILVVTFSQKLWIGKYLAQIGNFRDYWGNRTISDGIEFEIDTTNAVDSLLFVQKFEFVNNNKIRLYFSSALDSISATNLLNYRIEPFGEIVNVELGQDISSIQIELGSNVNIVSLGVDFYLVLGKIYSLDSTRIVVPPFNTIALTREAQEISHAFAYPNPIDLSKEEQLTFANIPSSSIVEIYDAYFRKILELKNDRWKGGIQIDIRNQNRFTFESGIYYFRVRRLNGDGIEIISNLKKFAVVQ